MPYATEQIQHTEGIITLSGFSYLVTGDQDHGDDIVKA